MSKRKMSEPLSALEEAMKAVKRDEERRSKLPSADEVKKLKKEWKNVLDKAKHDLEDLETKKLVAKPKRTRSGLKRGAPQKGRNTYTDGHIVNKGMDEVDDLFDDEEQKFLRKQILNEIKETKDLQYHHLRYLIRYEFFKELKQIKEGKLKSEFHDQYIDPNNCKDDLLAEVRTSLFSNEQRDYINGFLQGIFEANKKDEKGYLKHADMEYVSIVMLYETVLRIVKKIYKFSSNELTLNFIKRNSRASLGISDDEDDNDAS